MVLESFSKLSTLFLDERQRNDIASFTRVSNLANEVRGCKKTYARKAAARFKLDERELNIAISLQRSLVLERKGHIEIFRHFFPSLFSRFAPP